MIDPAQERPSAASGDRGDEERICRYCLSGDEDGELISPCNCRGDQRWVHLSCLQKWQRSVLVTQPTHPAFYEDDVRQRVCNVCRSEFHPPPPSRRDLMAAFTGPELALLLDVGCLIICERRTAHMMADALRVSWSLSQRCGLQHWIRGVYAIIGCKPEEASDGEDCIIAVNLTRPTPRERLPAGLLSMATRMVRRSSGLLNAFTPPSTPGNALPALPGGAREAACPGEQSAEPSPPQGVGTDGGVVAPAAAPCVRVACRTAPPADAAMDALATGSAATPVDAPPPMSVAVQADAPPAREGDAPLRADPATVNWRSTEATPQYAVDASGQGTPCEGAPGDDVGASGAAARDGEDADMTSGGPACEEEIESVNEDEDEDGHVDAESEENEDDNGNEDEDEDGHVDEVCEGESEGDEEDLDGEEVVPGHAPSVEVDTGVDLTHFIGGPCVQFHPNAITLLRSPEAAIPAELLHEVQRGGTRGGVWYTGELVQIAALARADALAQGGGVRPSVLIFWCGASPRPRHAPRTGLLDRPVLPLVLAPNRGDARWSRTQLLGELARGNWGMCRAEATDLFNASVPGAAANMPTYDKLWKAIVRSPRPIYAPQTEMTDTRAMQEVDDISDDED